jgi:hypothetical protein
MNQNRLVEQSFRLSCSSELWAAGSEDLQLKLQRKTEMNSTKFLTVAVATGAAFALAHPAYAADGDSVRTTIGVRTWVGTWEGNQGGAKVVNSAGGTTDAITHLDSSSEPIVIPFASVRYGNFGVSASVMMRRSFSFSSPSVTYDDARREWDLNASYFFGPGLSASLGYKHVQWSGATIKGPIVALSASAPLQGSLGIYGTLALGMLKTDVNNPTFKSGARTNYNLGEVGLSYSIGALKGSALTVGYRTQHIRAKGLWPITSTSSTAVSYSDAVDTLSGPTLGFLLSF